jgi:hypothetical protein
VLAHHTDKVVFESARRKFVARDALLYRNMTVADVAKGVHICDVWDGVRVINISIPGLQGSDLARESAVREVIVNAGHVLCGVWPELGWELRGKENTAGAIFSYTVSTLGYTVASGVLQR